VLRADRDKTFVIHFDHETELLQDLTSSRTDLQRALDQLQLPADGQPQLNRGGGNSGGGGYPGGGGGYPGGGGIGIGIGGIGMGRGMGRRGGGGGQPQQRRGGGGPGTTMYDAIYLASNEIMKKQQGRKAIILLTDGVDNGSKTFLNDAIEAAQRADTLAYSILFSDEQAYGQQGGMGGINRRMGGGGAQDRPDGKKVLERISKETGGTFYEVSKKLSIDEIFDRLQEELRNQYSLGYTPDANAAPSGYRTIKVGVRDPKLIVQSREGYYPGVR
jgi:VWFA-related protein